jgi:hypothetical protein
MLVAAMIVEQQAAWLIASGQAKHQAVPNFLTDISPAALLSVAPASVTIPGLG